MILLVVKLWSDKNTYINFFQVHSLPLSLYFELFIVKNVQIYVKSFKLLNRFQPLFTFKLRLFITYVCSSLIEIDCEGIIDKTITVLESFNVPKDQ